MKTKIKCNFHICHKVLVHLIIAILVQYQPASSSYVQLHVWKKKRILDPPIKQQFRDVHSPHKRCVRVFWNIFSYYNSYVADRGQL